MQKPLPLILLLVTSLILAGCDTLGYYGQAAHGQLSLLAAREPVTKLIADENLDPRLKAQLVKSQEILAFAEAQGLPVEKSYSEYVDLCRPFVVWNVFAAKPDSTRLKTHCFPIAGCVGYKGYFKQAAAEAYAAELKEEGFDVFVGGVTAYSTLGWFNDPLLNTFLFRPDERLSAVLFHELAHKVLYVEGDTVFNESYATAVERHVLRQWLKRQQRDDLYESYLASAERRDAVIDLILSTREQLAALYARGEAGDLNDETMLEQKAAIIAGMKQQYQALRASWQSGNEFAGWMAQDLNNAHLAAIGAYQSQVPGFAAMLEGKTLAAFFAEVEVLAELPKPERDQRLAELALAEHCHTHQGDDTCAN
jgi:predicted aminopeptidase